MTQQAVAVELGVTTRTLRNWKAAPAFQRERERRRDPKETRRASSNNPPTSLLDYNDAKRGLEPPAERRTRKQRDNPPPT